MNHLLALDQGTTSSRAIVFDENATAIGSAQREFQQYFPQPGWVEHDPMEIWQTQLSVAQQCLSDCGLLPGDIAGIGITNQRETTVVWDRLTGQPVCNAIVWQDRRTANACAKIIADGHQAMIQSKTGLVVDAYFSATKLGWILDNIDGARKKANRGELAFGTIDAWLVYNLSGGQLHLTDVSNASRTMLFNIHEKQWDTELLEFFDVPHEVLPTVCPSSATVGSVAGHHGLSGITIGGIAGDQQAALFGQACFEDGQTKNTFGTGCFMLRNTGSQPVTSNSKLLTTIAWERDGQIQYALEGSVFMGGAVIQWLRDQLGLLKSAADVESLAASVVDSDGVILVPAFTGLGAPHWDPFARGLIIGLTRGSSAAHVARAALDGIAFQVADLADAMSADCNESLTELRCDGGAAKNDLLMQTQSDLLQIPVVRPQNTETTALGAAYLAGLSTGVWQSLNDIACNWNVARRFEPSISADQAKSRRDRWLRAVELAKGWETAT